MVIATPARRTPQERQIVKDWLRSIGEKPHNVKEEDFVRWIEAHRGTTSEVVSHTTIKLPPNQIFRLAQVMCTDCGKIHSFSGPLAEREKIHEVADMGCLPQYKVERDSYTFIDDLAIEQWEYKAIEEAEWLAQQPVKVNTATMHKLVAAAGKKNLEAKEGKVWLRMGVKKIPVTDIEWDAIHKELIISFDWIGENNGKEN